MDPTHNIMRDPATASSRIYVGNLSELVSNTEIQQLFSTYGVIRGVQINGCFGFIQFENDESAQNAIKIKNNTMFHNRKLIVRTAVRSQNPNINKSMVAASSSTTQSVLTTTATSSSVDGTTTESLQSSIAVDNIVPSSLRGGQDLNRTARPAWTIRNQRSSGKIGGSNQAPSNNNAQATGFHNSNPNNLEISGRDRSPIGTDKIENKWSTNSDGTGINQLTSDNINSNNYGMTKRSLPQMYNQYNMPPGPPLHHLNQSRYFERNDCEIIVVSKSLTHYAEAIEERLKSQGMLVDLLFPNEDVPIGKVLSNISSRGCLFAILVTPEHEEYRRITVHILYGQPSEHRNMPVDDAITFICSNFNDKMRGGNSTNRILPKAVEITPTSSYAVPPLNVRHPDAIQTLINLLAENRPITVLQYDRVIKYLQERRTLQLKAEIGDAPNIPVPLPIDPEAELQKKILDILNKPSITNTPIVADVSKSSIPQPTTQVASPAISMNAPQPQILNDPKVQKALDSLLQGNLFNF